MRLVKGGQSTTVKVKVKVKVKVLGMPKQTMDIWVRLGKKGQLKGAGDQPVSPVQIELARLCAARLRVKMESDY